jgi:outer membrane protein OmpA-like peptidoglycan-associated protein/tetratricopeptide (TPR) repeat protein
MFRSPTYILGKYLQAVLPQNLRWCLFGFIVLLANSPLGAQTPDKWLEKGNAAFESGEYDKAIEYFDWSTKKSGGWQAELALAKTYRALMDYQNAGIHYGKVIEQPGIPVETYFYYGQTWMVARRYDEAEKWFARYAKSAPQDKRAAAFQNLMKLTSALRGDSLQFEVQKLDFNSKFSDFSPAYFDGGLLFSSARPIELGVRHISTIDDAPLVDLYFTRQDTSGKWKRETPFSSLNTKLNEGPLVYDSIGRNIYITRNDPEHQQNKEKGARRGLNRLQIEALHRDAAGQWVKGDPLPFVDRRYAVGHPALSADAKRMVFASDMPGGFGGVDLYEVQWSENGWSAPINLGQMVNTADDEVFPYLDDKGELYFASNGHLGLGGLDLFYVRRTGAGEWGRVTNLGYPVNTEADDFGILVGTNGNSGYFSSNRGGDRKDDNIYAFKRYWPIFECSPQQTNNYCFRFFETGIIDSDSLPLAYEWTFGDGTSARGLEVRHCFPGPGNYHVELNLIDTLLNFLFFSQSEQDYEVRDIEQVFIDCPDTVGAGESFVFSGEKSILAGCKLEEFYWETGDGRKEKGNTLTHSYDAPGMYEVRMGVAGNPNEKGDLVCKHCVTKTIVVIPAEVMKAHRESIEKIRRQIELEKMKTAPPKIFEEIRNSGIEELDLRDTSKIKYSVQVRKSTLPIDPKELQQLDSKDVTELHDPEGYKYVVGAEDKLKDIHPAYVDAHNKGYDHAIVVEVPDSLLNRNPGRNALSIPARKTEEGVSLFSAEIRDNEGNPLEVTLTFEDLEKGIVLFREKTDSMGRIQLKLPDGKIYAWYAEKEDFFPASGIVDLKTGSETMESGLTIRQKVQLSRVESLLLSGQVVRINNIFFDFDSDAIRPESKSQLDRVARILIEHPEFSTIVMAHTDDRGNDAYNMDLSRRRAASVMRYFILSGYDLRHIRSEGLGETKPAAPNDSPESRQLNRRVEFKFEPTNAE